MVNLEVDEGRVAVGLADGLDFFVLGDPKFDSCLPNLLLKPRNTIDAIYFATFLVSLDNYSESTVTSASASLQEKEELPVSRREKVFKDDK